MAHFNEDLNHYHLLVKYNTRVFEISEVFRHSNTSRNISAATVAEIKMNIQSKLDIELQGFYLTWKGQKLEPDTLKIRETGLPLHVQNMKDPIEMHIGNGNDVPNIVPEVASDSDDENPDYNNVGIQKKEKEAQNKIKNHELKMEAVIAVQRAKNLEKRRIRESRNV